MNECRYCKTISNNEITEELGSVCSKKCFDAMNFIVLGKHINTNTIRVYEAIGNVLDCNKCNHKFEEVIPIPTANFTYSYLEIFTICHHCIIPIKNKYNNINIL